MDSNEQKGLDAVINPASLTLGQLARLERIKSPLLSARFDNLNSNITALYVVSVSVEDFYRNIDSIELEAAKWAESMTREEYSKRLSDLCDGLVSFGILMPRPDAEATKKNDSETVG